MFESGKFLKSRDLIKSFGELSIEEKKVEMSPDEKEREIKGDKG